MNHYPVVSNIANFHRIGSMEGPEKFAGCVIGTFLEESGGAYVMAGSIMRMVGEKRVPLVMLILGYFISIPVFADSGFVILEPLGKALSKKSENHTGKFSYRSFPRPHHNPLSCASYSGPYCSNRHNER